MKKLLIFTSFLLLYSCIKSKEIRTDQIRKQIVYFKDDRTGLCFAAIMSDDPYDQHLIRAFTVIPCNRIDSTFYIKKD